MKISIIIPVYKVEKYIHRCVDSVLSQTFTDFELILVDDGSPDKCGEICDKYSLKDNRIHVIHKKNGGLSDARNAGIEYVLKHSDSEWITFIDSDDWVHNRYLEILYRAVQYTGLSVSIAGFKKSNGSIPDVDESKLITQILTPENLYCERNVNANTAWGKLYKKNDFITIRYPFGKIHEDEYTTYKILFKYKKIAFIDQPLYFYFDNPDGITSQEWSPEHLNQMYATKEQVDFFRNKWENAYYSSLNAYFWMLEHNYDYVRDNPGFRKQKKNITRMFKKALKRYSITIIERPDWYELLYPIRMKFYWIVKAQLNKIMRKNDA